VSWVAQFLGHGLAEKRAPALVDNVIGGTSEHVSSSTISNPLTIAIVLAPFFVHLEILFKLGYRPAMHKRINNKIGMEIARIRKAEGDKKRADTKNIVTF
jgi:2-hydroxy fatty acid dioxygenase